MGYEFTFLGTSTTGPHKSKAGHRATLRPCVSRFWHRASVYVRLSSSCRCFYAATLFRPVCVYVFENNACVREKTSVARVAHVLLLRPISGNMAVNTPASKRSELIGNAEIVRMRCVIHNNSTCVCLRLPVAAITQKLKLRHMAGLRIGCNCVFQIQ